MRPPREATHVAFSDESHYTQGRYRSLGVVSTPMANLGRVASDFAARLDGSGITELKWAKLHSARDRFAAEKAVEYAVGCACAKLLRIDVLIWDTRDSRHQVRQRDDLGNLARMYHHIFHDVLSKRWPEGARWLLRPDENSALSWDAVKLYLDRKSLGFEAQARLTGVPAILTKFVNRYDVVGIEPCHSVTTPLCQLADLFAGLAVYSTVSYQAVSEWQLAESGQGTLGLFEGGGSATCSARDKARIPVVLLVDRLCKERKLGVSLSKRRGFWTPNPSNPVNFWHYVPQHSGDKAPVKGNAVDV